VISEHWEADPRNVEIIPQFLSHDPVIQGVATRLALGAQSGFPTGTTVCRERMRVPGTSYDPLIFNTLGASSASFWRPPARRLKLILDYIEENLAAHRFAQLGELAGISTRHFERAFRQAIGVPPHAYVVRKRVARAQNLLFSEPGLTIDEIARARGLAVPATSLRRSAVRPVTRHGISKTTITLTLASEQNLILVDMNGMRAFLNVRFPGS